MPLENAVMLKISRTQTTNTVQLQTATQLLAVDGAIFSLFEQAKSQFNRSASKRYGFFDADAENQQLVALTKQWQNEAFDFLSFSNKASAYLQELLDSTEVPFSGSLLFAEEHLLGQHYLYCFWLPMVEVVQLDSDLSPFYADSIEPSKMPYALRLHIDAWQKNDSQKYLTLLAGKGNKVFSDAFKAFANFSEGVDLKQQTSEFLSIVDDYSEQLPEDEGKTVKNAVINYCVEQDKIGNPVNIEKLSEKLNENTPSAFAEFVVTQQKTPNAEVHTDRASLKRYMRYFGRDHSLSISFSAERFGTDVQYDAHSGSLRIDKIPKSLKIQLSGYKEKNE
jgi:nucleoid-associated protein